VAQTTDGLSFVDAQVEYSTDGSSFADISGFANTVEVSGGERSAGETYTADGDIAILTFGKRAPVDIVYTCVFTEGATDPFERFRGYHQTADGSQVVLRWSPAGGGGTGFFSFTGTGKITDAPWLGGDAESPDPLMFAVGLRTAELLKGVTA
jgi:hypothetical protein